MTAFQVAASAGLAAALLWELVRLVRGRGPRGAALVRVVVWASALVAIAFPILVQRFAVAIGIGRGADVVLYVFVLAFLGASFYFYSRYQKLQRQITALVAHLAIREARRGEETPRE